MSPIEEEAQSLLMEEWRGIDGVKTISPLFLSLLLGVAKIALEMYCRSKTAQQIVEGAERPSMFARMRVRRTLKRRAKEAGRPLTNKEAEEGTRTLFRALARAEPEKVELFRAAG